MDSRGRGENLGTTIHRLEFRKAKAQQVVPREESCDRGTQCKSQLVCG